MTDAAQHAGEHQAASAEAACLVAVLGPPGAGKTTVISALGQSRSLPVFRLREAVNAYSDLLADLAPSTDPLGWVGVQAVQRILRAAFIDGRFRIGVGPALLDNFPGTAHQLHRLADVAAVTGRRIAILELRADGSPLPCEWPLDESAWPVAPTGTLRPSPAQPEI